MMNQIELNAWFDKLELAQNEDEKLYYEEAPPVKVLQYMFLKRLDGHRIFLTISDIPSIGELNFDNVFDFDLSEMIAKGLISKFAFVTDSGKTGEVRLDWLSRVVTVTENGSTEPVYFTVSRFSPFSISRASNDTRHYCMNSSETEGFTVSQAPVDKLEFGILADLTTAEDEADAHTRGMTGFDVDKLMIEMGVLAQMQGKGYIPTRPVTAKEVAGVTGVPASTLSDLRTGKKSIANLTFSTLSVLSMYGNIKQLDGMIYDVFSGSLLKERPNTVDHNIMIELTSGEAYKIESTSHDSAASLHDAVVEAYNSVGTGLDLRFVVTPKGERLSRCMLRKDNVTRIYIVRANLSSQVS